MSYPWIGRSTPHLIESRCLSVDIQAQDLKLTVRSSPTLGESVLQLSFSLSSGLSRASGLSGGENGDSLRAPSLTIWTLA